MDQMLELNSSKNQWCREVNLSKV